MVMRRVESASFSFVVNGNSMGMVRPSRGLRQGDPLSPYLFLFLTDSLIGLLKEAERGGKIQGHQIFANAPPVPHLLFADDSIFFCKAIVDQTYIIQDILGKYERAFKHKISLDKSSVVFAKGTP